MKADLIDRMMASGELPEMLQELNRKWADEQRRRHEFWNSVTDDVKAEFINGEVVYHSPVRLRHTRVYHKLLLRLLQHNEAQKLGYVGSEKVMVRMTRNDYEPDICFFGQEKAAAFTDDQYIFPAPDFIIEILSEGTEERDRGIKFEDYARHGVQEYWIVDPVADTIEQYVLTGAAYGPALKLKTGKMTSAVIKGFSVAVAEIFAQ